MRIFFILLLAIGTVYSCGTTNTPNKQPSKEIQLQTNEEGEYDIIVFDAQYDFFLNTIAYPKDYYTEAFYKNRNTFLVTEWNIRHAQPQRYNPNIYELSIDYNPQIDYGKNVEYKLYNFFMFMEWKHNLNLGGGARRFR